MAFLYGNAALLSFFLFPSICFAVALPVGRHERKLLQPASAPDTGNSPHPSLSNRDLKVFKVPLSFTVVGGGEEAGRGKQQREGEKSPWLHFLSGGDSARFLRP